MAGGALARVVRQGIAVPVAGLAVHVAGVIEGQLVPVFHTGMAALAFTAIMIVGYLGLVAGGAVAGFSMLVVNHRPIRGILVTIHAFAGIVRRSRGREADQVVDSPGVQVGHIIGGQGIRGFAGMAGGAFLQLLMRKLGGLPAGDAVALGAFTGKVIRINSQVFGAQLVLIQAVAGSAVGGSVHIGPIRVAVQAFQVIMLAGQRELVVIDVVAQEGDGLGRDGAAQALLHGLGLCFRFSRLQGGVNFLAQRQHRRNPVRLPLPGTRSPHRFDRAAGRSGPAGLAAHPRSSARHRPARPPGPGPVVRRRYAPRLDRAPGPDQPGGAQPGARQKSPGDSRRSEVQAHLLGAQLQRVEKVPYMEGVGFGHKVQAKKHQPGDTGQDQGQDQTFFHILCLLRATLVPAWWARGSGVRILWHAILVACPQNIGLRADRVLIGQQFFSLLGLPGGMALDTILNRLDFNFGMVTCISC